ncbi:MAG TPA: helix-turn-helix domain-containing protein [Pseudonocardiaceae bacterium]|jgi:predicted ArsR family transcriptional regulator|nr:helix-turn-helix domain-containing protein [Pseudonocardiaceae bacterium]
MSARSDPARERSRTHGALAALSRVRILELLRGSDTPLDVQQIAAQRALHPNTVRFHLRILVDAGLVCSRPDPRGGSGRPRVVYTATTDGAGSQNPDGLRLLTDILASYLAVSNESSTGLAEEAGRAFARRHRRSTQPCAAGSADEAVRRVVAMFAELGFEPELNRDGPQHRILLHACPFRAVATVHPNVVCAMHLGLLKQTVANLDAPVEAVGLESFVTPHLCIAHLADAPVGPAPAQP